jgi:hypothetical protein
MSESNKIISLSPGLKELQVSPEDLQVQVLPEPTPEFIFDPKPQGQGLLENIFSFARRPFSGLAQLFGEATPLGVNVSSSASYLSFGQLFVFGSAARSFTVTNNGDQNANLMFSTSMPYSVTAGRSLPPGQSASFSVYFSPTRPGTYNAYVTGTYGISIALNGSAK